MMIIQRLGSSAQFDKAYIDALIEFKKRYPNGCNEVWLATSYGFPPIEKHRSNAAALAAVAKRLRKAGITVSVQLSNSIGHGAGNSSEDCSGLIYPGSPVRRVIGHTGEKAEYCFCWNDAFLRQYLRDEMTAYAAAVQPDYLWIDDDFRADNHEPVRYGCFCDDCLRTFNAQNGSSYTRKSLVEEMLHGSKAVRKAYIDFLRSSMASLMDDICKAVHEVSPHTSFGLQNSYHGYTGGNWNHIFEVMKKYSHKAPGYRPGGGVYDDHDPNMLFDKAYVLAHQNSLLSDCIGERIPEIENLPFGVFGKTPAGTALESTLDLATGCTGLSYSMMMRFEEEPDFYGKFFSLFDSMYPYFRRLSEISRISRGGGLHYALPHRDFLKTVTADGVEGFDQMNRMQFKGDSLLRRDAVPTTCDRYDGEVSLLCGQIVDAMTDDEIGVLLSGSVIMDGESAFKLEARGFGLGLAPQPMSFEQSRKLYEAYTDDGLNTGEGFSVSYYVKNVTPPYTLTTCPENARILGKYASRLPLEPITSSGDAPYGYASVMLTTRQGGTAAVFAYALFTGNVAFRHIARLLNAADALGTDLLPARILTAAQAYLFPRVEKHGSRTLSVTVVNTTVGEETYTVAIRQPAGKHFHWMGMYTPDCSLSYEEKNGEYIVTLPKLAAFTAGTIFCDAE